MPEAHRELSRSSIPSWNIELVLDATSIYLAGIDRPHGNLRAVSLYTVALHPCTIFLFPAALAFIFLICTLPFSDLVRLWGGCVIGKWI